MSKNDLSALFIDELHKTIPDKKKLAYRIADIVKIETESAYRRIAGKVNFSIYEMGLIAKQMNISLDTLLNQDADKTSILFEMGLDSDAANTDNLVVRIEEIVSFWQEFKTKEIAVNALFDSLPLEFYLFHPYLSKYIYFKWGYYYIGTKEFDTYSTWEVPPAINAAHEKLKGCFTKYRKVCYIWDLNLLPNMVNEINYHLFIGILTQEDAELIKNDLHQLLENLEEFIKRRNTTPYTTQIDPECYVTNLNVGMTGFSVQSEDSKICMSAISTSFLHSAVNYDRTTAVKINEWLNSIKKISYLISGSGNRERVVFFRKQHQIVNSIGTTPS